MKRFTALFLLLAISTLGNAQTLTFTPTLLPCHDDGVLTATITGLTPPLTVTWYTYGMSATAVTHTGASSLSDALTSYSGGQIYVFASDATGYAVGYYAGMPPFTYVVSATSPVCPVLGTATATVTGGTSPYTYQWFDASTLTTVSTANPVSLPSGHYGITITDASGCTYGSLVSTDSIVVNNIIPFSVSVSGTTASCTNGTAMVSPITGGTPPYSYLWSNGATTSSISGLTAGTYSLIVTDAAGCGNSGYTYVPQSVYIMAPVTPTPATCLSTDGAAIAFGSGGIPPYSYLWSNGATTQSQTGLAPAIYTVRVTDANGCYGSGGTTISTSTPIIVTYSATPSSCTSPTGTATIALAGGTAPYSVSWLTTPPQTGITALALPAGDYGYSVTDAAGCIRNGAVHVPPVDVMSASYSATSAHCTMATGGLVAYPAGGVTPYNYLWSTGATTPGITGAASGLYSVAITDAMSCTINKAFFVPDYSPLGIGISSTPASCIFSNDGSISATPFGGTLPYTYSWSNGGTTPAISSLPRGHYYLSVSDASGCTASEYDCLGYDTVSSCYCTISGTLYFDLNGNCVQDGGEPGIPHMQVYCSGIGYTYSDSNGHYSFIVPSGSYTVSETISAYYPLAPCQLNNIPVSTIAGTGCAHTVNFANFINAIHDMHICTWDYNYAIPGHTYMQATIISNEGTLTETGILAGYAPDGQLLVPSFVPAGIFSGSPYWYSTPGSFPSMDPGTSEHFYMNYSVPSNVPLGTNVLFKDSVAYEAPILNWLTDYSPWNNVNYFTTVTTASYDPNFKEVIPKGIGPTGLISYSDSVLEYMVHFQNTGTAAAENVVVIDTLDSNLDWASLHPIFQSSQGKITLTQNGTTKIATFTFNDINLPPASSDSMRSNGMFTYTIKTIGGLPIGSQFKNRAAIYFDYNAPIMTNTTINTLGSTTTAVSPIPRAQQGSFTIYPNPASQSFSAIINSSMATTGNMVVSDLTGKTLMTKTIALQQGAQTVATDISQLTPGVYFVTLNENGKTQTQKLVIMK